VRTTLDEIRISVSSIAANVFSKSMIAFIRTGNFGTGITIKIMPVPKSKLVIAVVQATDRLAFGDIPI